jgi:hypothetical protein
MPRKGRPRGFPRISLRNITRAEPKFYAWHVNITHRRKNFSRFFADGPDGPFQSLRTAIAWRDATWARVGAPSKVRLLPAPGGRVVGVQLEVRAAGDRYVAMWTDADGKWDRKRFSVDKYGKATAHSLAIAARQAGVAATAKERERRLLERLYMHRKVLASKT